VLYRNTGLYSSMTIKFCAILCAVTIFSCEDATKENETNDDQHTSWRNHGGGPDQSRYVVQNEITESNVKDLEVEWFYPTGDKNSYQFNPIIVDSVMYVLARNNSLVALNATTGKEIWIHANLTGIARRGINYWESKDGKDKRLIFQMNNNLQAIDADTGKSILSFGNDGLVSLKEGLNRNPNMLSRVQSPNPGAIFEDLIILGSAPGEGYMSAPGYLRAYNVVTGKLAWTFHTVPQPGEYGYDTWPKDAYKYVGGVNSWGEITLDSKSGIAYIPLGSPTYDFYGADRIGSNLYGNSILALDARTGKRIWHYQMVHHDLWDYDATAAPQLMTVNIKGKEIEAVAVVPKHGFVFVFDRHTGESLWPIEERPVPPSKIEGEEAWPTQPFPTVFPPTSSISMTKDDLGEVFLSKEEREEWMLMIDSMETGLFTPLSDKNRTLVIPGANGGVEFGSTASNPEKGILYVIGINMPSTYERLRTEDEMIKLDEEAGERARSLGKNDSPLYQQNCAVCHGQDRSGQLGPSLIGIEQKYDFKQFHQLMVTGRGEMPSFAHIKDEEIKSLYDFITKLSSGNNSSVSNEIRSGPVVDSGGAPGGQIVVSSNTAHRYGAPYPKGVQVDHERLFLRGYGLELPYIIDPPWSEIMAYDINEGKLKWKRPLGNDLEANALGFQNTGVMRGFPNGMIISSNGLVFSTSKDGNVYAFDADTGKELWKSKLPTGTIGLPSMYNVNGRQYLVIPSATPVKFGRNTRLGSDDNDEKPDPQGGYVVYALPEN